MNERGSERQCFGYRRLHMFLRGEVGYLSVILALRNRLLGSLRTVRNPTGYSAKKSGRFTSAAAASGRSEQGRPRRSLRRPTIAGRSASSRTRSRMPDGSASLASPTISAGKAWRQLSKPRFLESVSPAHWIGARRCVASSSWKKAATQRSCRRTPCSNGTRVVMWNGTTSRSVSLCRTFSWKNSILD